MYRHSILVTWILIVITELNNNVIGQLTLGLEKLMKEIRFVFWVDVGYRLRSRDRVPLSGMTEIQYCYCST